MGKKISNVVVIALAVYSVFALSACSSEVKSDTKQAEKLVQIPVLAVPVNIGSIDATYGTTASLEATDEAAVAARVSGIVTHIFVEEGDIVEAGQILAQLDVDKLSLKLKRAEANLNQIANDLRRHKKIYEMQLVSSEAYDRVLYQYEAQKAETELAKLNLEYGTIRAPISGIIALRYIKKGNLLTINSPAFHISDLSELQAIIHLPESEKAALAVGQTAYILVDAAKYPFKGQIERISPIVDKDSGTIRVTVSMIDKQGILRPGMFSRISIVYDTHHQTILVPKDSVVSQDEENAIFIIEDGIAYKRNISTGFSNVDFIEVLAGINADDIVVTQGQRNLKDKSNVELIKAFAKL